MKPSHFLQALLVRGVASTLRALPYRTALAAGASLGDLLYAAGLRRRVAEDNLRLAYPERDAAWHAHILRAHYRELGRVAAEYPRHPELLRGPRERYLSALVGEQHLNEAAARGKGVLLLTGHFGNFELLGATLAGLHPVDFVVQPLSNPGVESWLARQRRDSGVGMLSTRGGIKNVYAALRAGRWVALLADQDARRHGVFVPFFGRPCSTPAGPARIALATGAPIVFGACSRGAGGRHELHISPPLVPEGDPRDESAVLALTARHTALLEAAVRERPEAWFWLHRRWKTAPPV